MNALAHFQAGVSAGPAVPVSATASHTSLSAARALQRRCRESLCREAAAQGVELWVEAYEPEVLTLESIWSHRQRGGGRATAVLRKLCDMADESGVTLKLYVHPLHYGIPLGDEDEDRIYELDEQALTSQQLEAWYSRHGFVRKPGTDRDNPTMLRSPRCS